MSEVVLRKVLRERLKTIEGLPPLRAANTEYQLTQTDQLSARRQRYMEDAFLPSGVVETTTVGADGVDGNNGFYQINLFNAAGDGDLENAYFADLIIKAFPKGWTQNEVGTCVRIVGYGVSPGIEQDNYYMTPVRIEYIAYTNR